MPYIYENDPTKIGTNLQTAVAYLLSLHKNEYEWNLLGIKVIGVKEALPIPNGTYDYGDAYMIGTEADGYQLWIYTRADEAHSEAYWFNVGAFPKPGPQGPKGDGIEQINKWTNGTVSNITYDTTDGAKVIQTTTVDYTDSTDGSTKQQQFDTTTTLPIVPGKYISMNATSDNKKMEVKVDDTALALDYYKIDKRAQADISAPIYVPNSGTSNMYVTSNVIENSIAKRDVNGDCSFRIVNMTGFITPGSNQIIGYWNIWRNIYDEALTITKTPDDTGTLTATDLEQLKAPGYYMVKYDNKLYYRYDPREAPDGTLNYIHLDSIDDGNGGYKATGKCFSVTVSTREWKVVDLDFGGENYQHEIFMRIYGDKADWAVKFVINTSSSTEINMSTLYKYIYGGINPDSVSMAGTPVNVYVENAGDDPSGLGVGRILYTQSEPNGSPIYHWSFQSINAQYKLFGDSNTYSVKQIVDHVTKV